MQMSARFGTTQTIAYDATATATNALGSETWQVRLVSNSACHFRIFDANGTAAATTADPFLPANWETYAMVSPGQKVSAIKAATNGLVTATAGTLWISELS